MELELFTIVIAAPALLRTIDTKIDIFRWYLDSANSSEMQKWLIRTALFWSMKKSCQVNYIVIGFLKLDSLSLSSQKSDYV